MPSLLTDKDYYLRLRVTDAAGNTYTTAITTFTFDDAPPSAAITTPADGGAYSPLSPLPTIEGVASDVATGIASVEVQIINTSEDPDLYCDACGNRIPSAYAEPDND